VTALNRCHHPLKFFNVRVYGYDIIAPESDEDDSDDGRTFMTGVTGFTRMTNMSGKVTKRSAMNRSIKKCP